jgi:serine/threonine protein kinase
VGKPFRRCEHCLRTERPRDDVCPACGYNGVPTNPEPMLREGTLLNGRYILGRAEGQGGFSICYRAWDGARDEIVAIKELFPAVVARRMRDGRVRVEPHHQPAFNDAMRSMGHEAEVLQRLAEEPAIVKVDDFFTGNETAYLSAQFLRGRPYDQYLHSEYERHNAHVSVAGAVNIALRVLGALAAVHARGLLHLDVKPSNIRAVEGNQFILLDFGSARDAFRRDDGAYGDTFTPGFAALEQHLGSGTTSQATDVYGLAATLYYSLSLREPTRADDRDNGVPLTPLSSLNPTVPGALEAIIEKAMALDPADRYATATEMAKALEPFGASTRGSEPSPKPLPDTLLVRRFAAWVLDIVIALLATFCLAVTGLLSPEEGPGTLLLIWWATQLTAAFAPATPGMLLMALRLTDETGGKIHLGSLLLHTVLLTPPIVLMLLQRGPDANGTLRQDRLSRSRATMKQSAN